MGIVGKIAALLTLILSVVAVYFSHELYLQREALKGRTQNLENTVRNLAKTIEISPDNPTETIPIPDAQLMDFQQMSQPLNMLMQGARAQRESLLQTRVDLKDTQDTLAQREKELEQTRNDLAAARQTIAQQKDELLRREATIAELNANIQTLEEDKKLLTQELAEEKARSEEKDLQITGLEDKIADLEEKIKELEKIAMPDSAKDRLVRGDQGKLVYVNQDWNFVIFRAEDNIIKELAPELEFLVHRGENYVGTIKVSKILLSDQLVIAEILSDRQKMDFHPGDTVIY